MTKTGPDQLSESRRFDGRVGLVIGGGWGGPDDFAIGIGGAISWHLARDGARVAVLDTDETNALRTTAPILAEGGSAMTIIADAGVEADVNRAIDEVMSSYGRLDFVVNNVGIGTAATGYEPESRAAFDRVMAVNFTSEFLVAKHAVPHLPPGGSIVNIGSVFGAIDPLPGAYAISKRAVSLVATPTLAAEYAPRGIRVNGVTVGYVWNAATQHVKHRQAPEATMDEYREGRARALSALRIEGDGWDVARAVAFLVSDDARWITGQDLVVDGGYSLLGVFDVSAYGRNLAQTAP